MKYRSFYNQRSNHMLLHLTLKLSLMIFCWVGAQEDIRYAEFYSKIDENMERIKLHYPENTDANEITDQEILGQIQNLPRKQQMFSFGKSAWENLNKQSSYVEEIVALATFLEYKEKGEDLDYISIPYKFFRRAITKRIQRIQYVENEDKTLYNDSINPDRCGEVLDEIEKLRKTTNGRTLKNIEDVTVRKNVTIIAAFFMYKEESRSAKDPTKKTKDPARKTEQKKNPARNTEQKKDPARNTEQKKDPRRKTVQTLSTDHPTNECNPQLIIGSIGFLILIAVFVFIIFQYYSFYFNNSTEQQTPKESQAPDLISKEDIEEKNVEKEIVVKETHINLAFPSMSSSLFYDGRKARISISTEITSANTICSDSQPATFSLSNLVSKEDIEEKSGTNSFENLTPQNDVKEESSDFFESLNNHMR